jgi:hypothetical protein
LVHGLDLAYSIARDNLRKSAETVKKSYDKRVSHKQYKPGDIVKVKVGTRDAGVSKFQDLFQNDVYYVVSVQDNGTVRIVKDEDARPHLVHHNRLYPYYAAGAEGNLHWLDRLIDKFAHLRRNCVGTQFPDDADADKPPTARDECVQCQRHWKGIVLRELGKSGVCNVCAHLLNISDEFEQSRLPFSTRKTVKVRCPDSTEGERITIK